jgi:hypothetical protein
LEQILEIKVNGLEKLIYPLIKRWLANFKRVL